MKDLVAVINGTTNLLNLTGVMVNITNYGTTDDGTAALIATLNNTNDPLRLATVINGLSINGVISNDDDFETAQENNNWAVTGNKNWAVTAAAAFSGTKSFCAGVAGLNALGDNETASTEIVTRFTAAGTVSFARKVSTESGYDYLKFYVDDVLVDQLSGEQPWAEVSYGPYAAGVHRLRWEYVKDASAKSGEDAVYIDKVAVPGNRGADTLPFMKIAILLNQLSLSQETTIAETLNGLDPAGLTNLIYIVNRTVYPPNPDVVEPRIVSIVNNMSAVSTLTSVINGLTGDGPRQLTDIMDYTADVSKVYGMVNGLAGNPGEKLYQIINGVTPAGTSALVRFIDGISLANILTVMNGVSTTAYVPVIFNNLDLAGTNVSTIGASSAPTAGKRLVDVINEIADGDSPGTGLTVGYHVVRMINDLSAQRQYGGRQRGQDRQRPQEHHQPRRRDQDGHDNGKPGRVQRFRALHQPAVQLGGLHLRQVRKAQHLHQRHGRFRDGRHRGAYQWNKLRQHRQPHGSYQHGEAHPLYIGRHQQSHEREPDAGDPQRAGP